MKCGTAITTPISNAQAASVSIPIQISAGTKASM